METRPTGQLTDDDRRAFEERRGRRRRFVFFDRRTGFERRGDDSSLTAQLRSRDYWVAILLVSVNLLNVADLVYTQRALAAGAREINPIMAALFSSDPVLGAVVKISVVATASLVFWAFRRYRTILQMLLASAVLFTGIGLYQAMAHLALVQ